MRRATERDAGEISEIWLASFRATYPGWPSVHSDDEVRAWIRDVVVRTEETWVAVEPDGTVAGFMALTATDLDQLYLRPDRTGQGIGSRLVELAKRRRPQGLRLYTFQVNAGARRFYERHGFQVVDFDSGERNEEHQPDVQYTWPRGDPSIHWGEDVQGATVSQDGTSIAWFATGKGSPIVLVHGATADHTAWRTSGPLLARSHRLYAIDRRGRGASGDTPPYAIEREYEDLAAVVDQVSARRGGPIDVVGHSYGGRVGLGAALLTSNVRRLVVYEGAPAPEDRSFQGIEIMGRLEALNAAGDREGLLSYFMTTVVGMSEVELATFRASPTWPLRVEAAPTVVREMWAEASAQAGPERYAGIRIPVLQLVGGDSESIFTEGTWALDRLLPNSRVVVLPAQKHAAHHTDPERFVAEVRRFLEADEIIDSAQ